MSYSNTTKQRILDELIGNAASVGLLTRLETTVSNAEEPMASEYSRQPVTIQRVDGTLESLNTVKAEFPRVEEAWGQLVGYGLFGADGELVYQLQLDEPVTLVRNLRHVLEPGAMRIMVE